MFSVRIPRKLVGPFLIFVNNSFSSEHQLPTQQISWEQTVSLGVCIHIHVRLYIYLCEFSSLQNFLLGPKAIILFKDRQSSVFTVTMWFNQARASEGSVCVLGLGSAVGWVSCKQVSLTGNPHLAAINTHSHHLVVCARKHEGAHRRMNHIWKWKEEQ